MKNINTFDPKVYLTVPKIPYGKVATYGQIADLFMLKEELDKLVGL